MTWKPGQPILDLAHVKCELANAEPYFDEDSGEWPMQSLGIYISTVGHRGRKGEIFDFWVSPAIRVSGDDYPGDSSRQLAQFGDLVIPWGSNPALQMT